MLSHDKGLCQHCVRLEGGDKQGDQLRYAEEAKCYTCKTCSTLWAYDWDADRYHSPFAQHVQLHRFK